MGYLNRDPKKLSWRGSSGLDPNFLKIALVTGILHKTGIVEFYYSSNQWVSYLLTLALKHMVSSVIHELWTPNAEFWIHKSKSGIVGLGMDKYAWTAEIHNSAIYSPCWSLSVDAKITVRFHALLYRMFAIFVSIVHGCTSVWIQLGLEPFSFFLNLSLYSSSIRYCEHGSSGHCSHRLRERHLAWKTESVNLPCLLVKPFCLHLAFLRYEGVGAKSYKLPRVGVPPRKRH